MKPGHVDTITEITSGTALGTKSFVFPSKEKVVRFRWFTNTWNSTCLCDQVTESINYRCLLLTQRRPVPPIYTAAMGPLNKQAFKHFVLP